MPETAGEYVDIPALLKGILNGYPGNSAIFREYLQNSDDAKASSQTFILDERVYPTESLVDQSLKDSQGPALVAINNGILEPADWTALQKIHSSSKALDESRTGKNGLGFRASYHLTENPHLLSGRKLLILDAHRQFKQHAGGVSMDFIDEGPSYSDQLAPFTSFIGDSSSPYPGTVFRLPLRTENQASTSRIKDTPTPVAEIQELLYNFCSNEAEEVILFLKHIKKIEVKHLKRDGSEVRVGAVEIEGMGDPGEGTIYRKITITNHEGGKSTRVWCHHRFSTSREKALELMKSRLGYNLGTKLQVEKLSAIVELAFPMTGPPVSGRLYTLLPLPISTGFPLHLNAVFALTPDRQSLKNSLEIGGQKSRERLLVEWNRVVFELWAPAAWAELLVDLVKAGGHEGFEAAQVWSFWPPQQFDKGQYWAELPNRLISEILRRRLAAFPSVARDRLPVSFVSLHDPSILLAGPNPGIALESLASLDIDIVQAPPYLFSIIAPLKSSFKASILSPQSLYERLLKTYSEKNAPPCDEKDVHVITDYLASLASLPTIPFICHVPWFSCTDNSRVALGSLSKKYVVPSTEEESNLFSSHPRILSWGCMSRAMHAHVSNPLNFGTLNVSALKPEDVMIVLNTKFRHLQPRSTEIRELDHQWLIRFWTWMANWPKLNDFFRMSLNKCGDLYILPTAERKLRKLSAHSFIFRNTHPIAMEAWCILGVHPLHGDLGDHPASMMKPVVEVPRTAGYVPLLIRTCDTKSQTRLSQDALLALQGSLYDGLPTTARFSLSSLESSRLATMHVFRIRSRLGDEQKLGSIRGHAIYAKVDKSFPFPIQPDMDDLIYVDMSDDPTAKFVQLVNVELPHVLSEVDFLRIAFDHWELQPAEEKDNFILWIFQHVSQVPQELFSRLKTIPFVEVEKMEQRVPPVGLIDPTCALEPLYTDEAGKFPAGIFRGKYLQTMLDSRFLHSGLDAFILKERLDYLSSSLVDPHRFNKAKHLIDLLNGSWKLQFKDSIVYMRPKPWLPCNSEAPSPESLVSPHQCRDQHSGRGKNENPFYYDLALHILPVDIHISSQPFREALGWLDVIRPDVLVKQFRLTVDLDPSGDRNERLMALIHYLGSLHHEHKLSSSVVDDLVTVSADRSWIPISKYGKDTVATKFALLSPDVDLKLPFFHIENFQYPAFLEEMGCTARPKLEVLVAELAEIDFQSAKGTAASVSILQEIADEHPGFEPSSILIPGDNDEGLPLHRVFFRDMTFLNLSGGMVDLVPTHNSISRALAESLGIPFLSALMLDGSAGGQDDHEEDEQMSEDFVNRIQGFLREYDVRYALNEFLANADDAQATQFSLLLDTPTDIGKRFLSPAFQKLAGCSRLALYNNAAFSDADFIGLRHVGLGGKRGQANTHGRHGLGALSFYYFTDVVTVISGERVMFLDPSGEYLPPFRHGKRTALTRTIAQVSKQFPDQLKAYESLFDFSTGSAFYDGTLFILPLKSSISETPCTLTDVHDMIKTLYKTLSANAFFFTRLQKISANERTESGDRSLWSFSATRQPETALEDGFTRHNLTIKYQIGAADGTTEKWLITTSEDIPIPEIHEPTAQGLNLSHESSMHMQLAIRMDNASALGLTANSSLFSTLRLPKSTSLPFHINSRFSISSNRQSVVLLPIGNDNQMDPKTAYNVWILKELVPPLYLSTLDYLVHGAQKRHFYRDIWWLLNSDDDISKLVRAPFLEALAKSKKMLFQDGTPTRNWLPYCDAVFSASQPSQVTDLLVSIKAPKFVLYEHLKEMAHQKSTKIADGQFVKHSLSTAGLIRIRDLYKDKKIDSKGLARIMDYVRKEEGLEGLPLLVLSSGELIKVPDKSKPPVHRPTSAAITALFSTGRFMAHDYTQESVKRLIEDDNINVFDLTGPRILTLIHAELDRRDSVEQNEWLDLFWRSYHDLPTPPGLPALEEFKVVKGSSRTLRLSECTSNLVIYQSQRHSVIIEQPILDILRKFDFEIVNVSNHLLLDDYLSSRFPNPVTNVLLCMESREVFNWRVLTNEESQALASWIRDRLDNHLIYLGKNSNSKVTTEFLRQVPMWIAQTHQRQMLHSASGLRILPPNFQADHIRPYQKAGVVVAPYSFALVLFMQFLSSCNIPPKTISPKSIMDIVNIPRHIAPDDAPRVESMKSFISSMLNLPSNELQHASLQVPDRQGNLRPIGELYDDIPLFSATLNHTERSSFVHASFRDLQLRLHQLGLRHQVNPTTFAVCARAISQALQLHGAGSLARTTLFQMSDAAYEVYQTSLPRMIMINGDVWNSIDSIAFVRRKDIRRQGATYDVERYFDEPLPLLLPPSRFVRQSMEAIAWTQRALFFQEPSDEVLALNKAIGIPAANEVVEHLKVLATRIAPDHFNNPSVLHDLQATYNWLNDHVEEAHDALESAADVAIFLNVNDPGVGSWAGHWLTAREMVLHLHYDAGRLKRVGRFLQRYEKVLEAPGCVSLKAFERGSHAAPTRNVETTIQDIRTAYNEMRKGGDLTDVTLVPSTIDDAARGEEAAVNDPELRAHLSFLAATIPYVRRSASGWSVTTTGKITFYGSMFGAKALLDFTYTGDFERPTPTGDTELANLLRDLLELLPIADEWDLPQLKQLLEHKIIHKYDMIRKLPHEYQIMVEQAEKYKADTLKKALSEFEKANKDFLNVLQDIG